MKKGIHPEYREVVFHDVSCGEEILTKSTIKTDLTTTFEGKEYPMVKLDISSASHPFYTGKQKVLDTEGRIEKFKKKFGNSYAALKKK
ncbi:type B 50S ribosomal protein L31 [Halobacteriovorax sp. GB3]|uniref:type B 50S ribosomal protein L31 n=1 Tax=Halobacteriovorax sp. GB3 TaxID=2719615 RepID=UPI00235F53DC|nr:type B 50S ribosomal protein L31 [Halobacteriovorax sp. GB3]MDD0851991.1 type B 50S ribosomal protein L31 [Halobacteriovorax sp. GB3]